MIVIEACLLLICAVSTAGGACFRLHRLKSERRAIHGKRTRRSETNPIPPRGGSRAKKKTLAVALVQAPKDEKKQAKCVLGCPVPPKIKKPAWPVPSPLAHLVKLAPEEIVPTIIAKTILMSVGSKERLQLPSVFRRIGLASVSAIGVGHSIDPNMIARVVRTAIKRKGGRFRKKQTSIPAPSEKGEISPSAVPALARENGEMSSSALVKMPSRKLKGLSMVRITPSIKRGLKRVRKLSRARRRKRKKSDASTKPPQNQITCK